LFAVKVLAGFAMVFLYANYYDKASSDIYIYFNDAVYLKKLFLTDKEVFWNILTNHNLTSPAVYEKYTQTMYWDSSEVDFLIHEKRLIILLNFLISFISFGNIYIHSMFMAFIGFFGQVAIFRFVKKQSQIKDLYNLIVTFLLPTFLLWSSTILKEPLIIFAMGMLLFYSGKWTKKWESKYLIALFVFYILGLFVKPYVIIALSFPLAIFLFFKFKRQFSFKKQSLIVVSGILLLLLSAWAFKFVDINVFEKLSNKQQAFYNTIALVEQTKKVGSQIELEKLEPSISSFILNSPKAFSNVMFKPSFADYRNVFYLPDIFQNIILLILSLIILKKYRKPKTYVFPFLWLSILFIVSLFTIIGLVTPVLGAIVRYKIPALIFVFYLLLTFFNSNLDTIKINKYIFNQ
jgi:hypothetical protein